MTLAKLIAALEAATGPSRELDAEIALAVGAVPPICTRRGVEAASARANWWSIDDSLCWSAPAYTKSLDASITTVPEGWRVTNLREATDGERWYWIATVGLVGESEMRHSSGKPAAIALVTASLRARLT